mmetsp:Transcript_58508/g.166462  ORF Transcript_58508/g.166462 Transcript_58508/m.166462 type:complete len:335 (+) Transcript_58508:869-1873(+)
MSAMGATEPRLVVKGATTVAAVALLRAMPTWAARRAPESLPPSPTMAQMRPWDIRPSTTPTLPAGVMRAKMRMLVISSHAVELWPVPPHSAWPFFSMFLRLPTSTRRRSSEHSWPSSHSSARCVTASSHHSNRRESTSSSVENARSSSSSWAPAAAWPPCSRALLRSQDRARAMRPESSLSGNAPPSHDLAWALEPPWLAWSHCWYSLRQASHPLPTRSSLSVPRSSGSLRQTTLPLASTSPKSTGMSGCTRAASFAIRMAVPGASPVIITLRTSPPRSRSTASLVSLRRGFLKSSSPSITKPFSASSRVRAAILPPSSGFRGRPASASTYMPA